MRALFYIVIFLLVTGCSCSGTCDMRGLDEARSIMEHDPVRALELLNGYDVAEFSDSSTMARWALLYSEAMAANHLTAPTDTIIDIAINYYRGHDDVNALDKALRLKDSLNAVTGRADALAAALYLQKEKEFMIYKERARRTQLVFAAIIIIILSAGVIIWQRQRLRLKNLQNESLMAEASLLKDGLSLQQLECCSLNARLAAILAHRFDIIDDLCGTYYEQQGTRNEKKAIVEKVKSQIDALKSDEGIFAQMEKCHEDLLLRLRKQMPDLKPEEYRLMVYLAGGLSSRTIALLIGENINVAYKRKSRLKARISESAIEGKEQFLALFR